MSFNLCQFMGRLVRDVSRSATPNGIILGNFTLAVNSYVNGKEEVLFMDCVVFGKTADNASRYLSKGSNVFVCGEMRQNTYTGRDGQTKTKYKLCVEKMAFCDFKRSEAQGNPQQAVGKNQQPIAQMQQAREGFYKELDGGYEGQPQAVQQQKYEATGANMSGVSALPPEPVNDLPF